MLYKNVRLGVAVGCVINQGDCILQGAQAGNQDNNKNDP